MILLWLKREKGFRHRPRIFSHKPTYIILLLLLLNYLYLFLRLAAVEVWLCTRISTGHCHNIFYYMSGNGNKNNNHYNFISYLYIQAKQKLNGCFEKYYTLILCCNCAVILRTQ